MIRVKQACRYVIAPDVKQFGVAISPSISVAADDAAIDSSRSAPSMTAG
jgi:hypothetical protein